MKNIPLVMAKRSRWRRWRKSMFISGSALFLFLTGIQHLVRPEPLQAAGVGVVVTLIALVSTLALVTFQRWVVRKTQEPGGAGGYASLSV